MKLEHFIFKKKILWIFFIFILIFFIYKPLYIFFVMFIFFFEYFWFIIFIVNMRKHCSDYFIIQVNEINLQRKNSVEIWIEYCKLLAFQKLYLLFSKNKKLNFFNCVWFSLIIILGIPYKMISLFYRFSLKNKNGFENNLKHLYFDTYSMLKNCKIEILNETIYLNCFTKKKLCYQILGSQPNLSEKDFLQGMRILKNQIRIFDKFEKESQEVKLISGFDQENRIIFTPHFGYYENSNSLHATSNVNFNIDKTNQCIDSAIPDLTKFDAVNAGTVITKNLSKVCYSLFDFKIVKTVDLNSIKYNHSTLFELNLNDYDYINQKNQIYENILQTYFGITNNSLLCKDLRSNNYNFIISQLSLNDFSEGYEGFFKTHNFL